MADGTAVATPEMVEIEINDQKVMVTKESADVIKSMEKSIKSGYQQKFDAVATDRTRVQQEAEQLKQQREAMTKDVEWFNSHDASEWRDYEMLSDGGRGYVPGRANPAKSGAIYDPDPETRTPAEIEYLKNKIAELEKFRNRYEQESEMTMKERVKLSVEAMDELLSANKLNKDAELRGFLIDQLDYFHTKHGRPANEREVEGIFNRVKAVGAKTSAVTKPESTPAPTPTDSLKKPGLPTLGNKPPVTSKEPVPDIHDIGGITELARKKMIEWGGG